MVDAALAVAVAEACAEEEAAAADVVGDGIDDALHSSWSIYS